MAMAPASGPATGRCARPTSRAACAGRPTTTPSGRDSLLLQNVRDSFVGGGLTAAPLRLLDLADPLFGVQIRVDGLRIRNNDDGRGPSTDGVDIDSSRRVLVRRVDIAVNDDAFVIKAGRDADGLRVNRPTRDVLIANCRVRDGATGIAFGSESSGRLRAHTRSPAAGRCRGALSAYSSSPPAHAAATAAICG